MTDFKPQCVALMTESERSMTNVLLNALKLGKKKKMLVSEKQLMFHFANLGHILFSL